MKKITIALVLAVTLASCNSNDDQVNPIKNVSKKIKSIKTSTSGRVFEYGSNDLIKRENFYHGNDGILGTKDYVYNSDNKIIECNQQNRNKKVDGTYSNFFVNVTYEYENELIISSLQTSGYLEDAARNITRSTYEYSNNNLIKEIKEITNSFNNFYTIHTFYTYDNGKLKSKESKNFENGTYVGSSVITFLEYDSKINPEYKIYPESFSKIDFSISYNNIISYIESANDKTSGYNMVITYNNMGLPEKKVQEYRNGTEFTYLYEYEID